MATEGAGGLSTTAIERCIDNWADETQDGDEIPAARAELAALVEAAGYGAGLTAALIGAEYILTCLLGAGEFLVPRTPERCYRVMIGQDQHKSALRALRAARDALAGRGAAGARDETADLAAENARLRAAIAHFVAPIDPDDRAEFGTFVTVVMEAIDRLRAPLRPGDVEAALASWPDDPALDAPRAGGAGETETIDG
jgi:hypothetical protein